LTVLAVALLLALAPADAAAQRRGGPAHGGGGRQVVVVRPAHGPYFYGGFYDPFFWGSPGWHPYGFYAPVDAGGYGRPTGSARLQVTPNQDFFIAEPQVNAVMSLTKWLRVDAGVGYQLIGGADLLNEDLRGISGSIALQLGGR
jgi:hypothetical protein